MSEGELKELVAMVTPQHVLELALAVQKGGSGRARFDFYKVLNALSADVDIGTGAERRHVVARLREAVIAAVNQTEAMSYAKGT